MLDNYNLTLLSGGYYRCDAAWTKNARGVDQCYKVYFPVSGEAGLEMDSGTFKVEAQRIYFISGFRLKRQICESRMDVYWLHFVPESLYLRYMLDQLDPAVSWSRRTGGWPARGYTEVCRIFDDPFSEENRPRQDTSPAVACRIQGLLLTMISRLLERLDSRSLHDFHPEYYRLKPALDYMHDHYRENPALSDIAGTVHLAANYFHRRFRALFRITPFNYMLARRLDQARHLLASTALSVKEVAEDVGYENPLYFSRVFSAQMQVTPSDYRTANQWSAPQRKSTSGGR